MSDTVRVCLGDDYYEHEFFSDQPEPWWDKDPERAAKVEGVYELPRKQVERWRAAGEAWEAAQSEMRALMAQRSGRRIAQRQERYRAEAPGPDEVAREQAERWQASQAARAEAQYWGEASREMIANMTERRERQIAERLAEIRRGLYGGRQR